MPAFPTSRPISGTDTTRTAYRRSICSDYQRGKSSTSVVYSPVVGFITIHIFYPFPTSIISPLPISSTLLLPNQPIHNMSSKSSDNIPPVPAYFPTSSTSPLHPPKALYARLKSLTTSSTTSLHKLQDFTIAPRSGQAWRVPKASLVRLSTPSGPQVGDLNIWNAHNPREHFWAARTRQLQGSHVQEGDRLWSCLPYMRPLCGVVADGCEIKDVGREASRDERGGVTKWGGRCHDLLGTRCDPYGEFLFWRCSRSKVWAGCVWRR